MKFLNSLRYLLAIFTLSLLACQPSGGNDQTGNGPMGQQTESANTSAPVQKDTAKILEDYDNTNRVK